MPLPRGPHHLRSRGRRTEPEALKFRVQDLGSWVYGPGVQNFKGLRGLGFRVAIFSGETAKQPNAFFVEKSENLAV